MKEDNCGVYVIHIRPESLLTRDEYEKIYSVIFARKLPNTQPSIISCLRQLALGTQIKIKTNEEISENLEEVLIYWKIDKSVISEGLKRFKSNLLSVYSEGDHEYKLLKRRDKKFSLLGVSNIRLLSIPESVYLINQLNSYIEKYLPRQVVKILK
jgi:hypothetical protein